MFINKMDEYVDNIFNNFFKLLNNNKKYILLVKNKKLYKNHKDIDDICNNYIKSIDKDMKKMFNNKDNIENMTNLIKKYLYLYLYLDYGILYDDSKFKNDLLKIKSLNKIIDSSNITSIIIKFQLLINNIIFLSNIEYDKINKEIEKNKKLMNAAIFLNDIGYEYTINHFKGNKKINNHNIIKTIIFREIYKK